MFESEMQQVLEVGAGIPAVVAIRGAQLVSKPRKTVLKSGSVPVQGLSETVLIPASRIEKGGSRRGTAF
jgi:hypothetical protein